MTAAGLRFLLLQVRHDDDPMRIHERRCFARAIGCAEKQIGVHDLIHGPPSAERLDEVDIVLFGGSGDYSVSEGGAWLDAILEEMRVLRDQARPTFASCWGFQAMAKALGGTVVRDLGRAEVGIHRIRLTEAGLEDPVMGPLGLEFRAAMGHQDIVDTLPPGTTRLASTDKVENQAFRVDGLPIYCTQFHPELNRKGLLERLRKYPQYVQKIEGVPYDEFERTIPEVSHTESILVRFVCEVTGAR